jgi:hypothetical protein
MHTSVRLGKSCFVAAKSEGGRSYQEEMTFRCLLKPSFVPMSLESLNTFAWTEVDFGNISDSIDSSTYVRCRILLKYCWSADVSTVLSTLLHILRSFFSN